LVIGPRSLSNPNLLFELGVAAASDRPVIAIIGSSTPEVLSSFVTKFANIHQVRTDDAATAADELERVAEHIKGKA